MKRGFDTFTVHPVEDGESKGKISLMFNYDHVIDGIHIGTNACCIMHFSQTLLRKGIQADISLQDDFMDQANGAKYFFWIPVKDDRAPSLDQLDAGVMLLSYFVKRKIKSYVHCKNGHGRAPTLVVAYLISTGMQLGRALALVKERRPVMHLSKAQVAELKKFEKRFNQRKRRAR